MTPGIPMIPVNHPIMGERALEVDSFPGRGAPGTIPNPLPSHTLTHEGLTARIVAFLSGNGGSQSVAAICQALGEPFGGKRTQLVRNALCKAGKRGLVENTARGLWGLPGVTSER